MLIFFGICVLVSQMFFFFSSLFSWYPVIWKYLEGVLTHSAVMASYSFDKSSTQKHLRRYEIRTDEEGERFTWVWDEQHNSTLATVVLQEQLCASKGCKREGIIGNSPWQLLLEVRCSTWGPPDKHNEENKERQDKEQYKLFEFSVIGKRSNLSRGGREVLLCLGLSHWFCAELWVCTKT